MAVDSLDELKSAFAGWGRGERHAREAMPEELLVRARRATKKHGVKAVVRATRVERARLFRSSGTPKTTERARSEERTGGRRSLPTYSRLELGAVTTSVPGEARAQPIAEVVAASGATLRMFQQTPEVMGLLAAVCGLGG